MDTDLYRHFIYQMLLALFMCVILIAACSVVVKKLLVQNDIPFVKRRLLNILFFLGVIPLWIEVIHFIPFNGEHIAKLLAKLPERAELFLIDSLNPVFAVIYSYMSHIFLFTYIAIFLGILFLPKFIENISDKRIRFATFTLATAGLYPVYAGIAFLYNPRIIHKLRHGTKVFRNPAQAEKAIINMTQEEDFNFEIEFEKYLSNEIKFSMSEKVIMFLEWVLLEPLANGMIFGLVQYEMFGADPMKRRLIDQVSVILKNVKPKKT